MCGIAGLLDRGLGPEKLAAAARTMGESLAHRGPDGEGVWTDPEAGIALAHRRLAVVDLSPAGAQPMVSRDGRWIVTYNGELYDAPERRPELERDGHVFAGTSDTEILVELIARRGVAGALEGLDGIFAFAAWDRAERRLHLARDRMGVKPLFYAAQGGRLLFGSELRALLAVPGFRPGIDPAAVSALLAYGYVPGPAAILTGVRKLPAGTILAWRPGEEPRITPYWTLGEARRRGRERPFAGGLEEAAAALDGLLREAVRRQLMGDVPLGAFLSGGVDSTLVAALMAREGRLRTVTAAFGEDPRLDEGLHAARVAAHLGAEHVTVPVGEAEALALAPALADLYDEPLADPSCLPAHLVARAARRHGLAVALTGDGGDELFAGYDRYRLARLFEARVAPVPLSLRIGAATLLGGLPAGLSRLLPRPWAGADPGETLAKVAQVLPLDAFGLYRRLSTLNPDARALAPGMAGSPHPLDGDPLDAEPLLARMRGIDAAAYLPDDVLAKVDRAGMAVGLEARVPFLDRRVVEFAWTLPEPLLLRGREGKRVLRAVLARHLPRPLWDRPKRGFAVPLARWLRGPLRPWACDLLLAPGMGGGLLDPVPVRAMLEAHLSGRRNAATGLWPILTFEAWRRRWAP